MVFNRKEYMKEYGKKYRQENRDKIKEYDKKWRRKNKDKKRDHDKKYREKSENKARAKEYRKEYYQRLEVKERIKKYLEKNKDEIGEQKKRHYRKNKNRIKECRQKPEIKFRRNVLNKQRKKTDSNYNIQCRIKSNFCNAMKIYSTKGKIMSTSKYLDMPAIIKKLTPFPKDRENYEVDHIIPLCVFNHNDPEQIRKAWSPENLQWLPKEINLWKGDRLIKPLTEKQKTKLLKQLQKK